MTVWVALLRGINVSGHKPVPMAKLRESLIGLDFRNVQTYVQSGNVVFSAVEKSASGLEAKIEERLEENFGFSIPVILRTAKELSAVACSLPFTGKIDRARLYVTFLRKAPPKSAKLEIPAGTHDEFQICDREIYLHCPEGYGATKLSNAFFERKFGVEATTRNWKTVQTLRTMAADHGS